MRRKRFPGENYFRILTRGGIWAEYANEAENISGRKLEWEKNFRAENTGEYVNDSERGWGNMSFFFFFDVRATQSCQFLQ